MPITPGEQFANNAMAYIATGQILAAVVFLIFLVWFWATLYERLGGLGGFLVGMFAGTALALVMAALTFFAWPLALLGLLVFALSRYRAGRRRREPFGFQP